MNQEYKRPADPGEREFLVALLNLTRSAQRSNLPAVSRAAREWERERVIRFRIRVTLQQREHKNPHRS